MVVQPEQEPHTAGELIRFWRMRRGLSQLELEAHEPNLALIVDGLWNLIESNRAASLLWVARPAGGSCGS